MGWFRFDDKAIDHPKFLALSDGAFRLWIEGGAYCNRHLTDGRILRAALNGFRYVTRKRVDELVAQRLWEVDGDGFRLHDYHDWNDPKDVVEAKKEAGRERTRKWRQRSVTPPVSDASQHAHIAKGVGGSSSGIERRKGDPFTNGDVTERAGRFIERYQELYQQHRGARYLVRDQRDYQAAVPLCATWTDDARLDKLAAIFLTTDHKWASEGSRTIPQFAALASWCDGQLAEWEKKQGVA
jgi:hypothetical protein